jgi:hypothetical protein
MADSSNLASYQRGKCSNNGTDSSRCLTKTKSVNSIQLTGITYMSSGDFHNSFRLLNSKYQRKKKQISIQYVRNMTHIEEKKKKCCLLFILLQFGNALAKRKVRPPVVFTQCACCRASWKKEQVALSKNKSKAVRSFLFIISVIL